jgi:diaminopropionate ammonia-lyase
VRLSRNRARDPAAVAPPCRDAPAWHAGLPGYAPTPLREAPRLAAAWGVGRVWLKDETERLGLPSFKVLGASWAVERTLRADTTTLVAATDGNHGRAVAQVARLRSLRALILVPAATLRTRVEAIASEGAEVGVIDGSYDEAVAAAEQAAARPGHLLVSDAASPHVVDGYATLGAEVAGEPDAVVVPVGVGALAAAVVRRFPRARVVGVEPESAACVLASLEAGERVSVPLSHESAMAGLNCGTPSPAAWPDLRAGLWGAVAIDDETALAGMRLLADEGVSAGECGGAAAGAAAALLTGPAREELALAPGATVLLVVTEGPTGGARVSRGPPEAIGSA